MLCLQQILLVQTKTQNNMSATNKPMQTDEFSACLNWWQQREENKYAWRVSAEEVLKYGDKKQLINVNLDIKNPHSLEVLEHKPPSELAKSIIEKEHRILEILKNINVTINGALS